MNTFLKIKLEIKEVGMPTKELSKKILKTLPVHNLIQSLDTKVD
jgi:hypothetical protein